MRTNQKIRDAAWQKGVHLWEVAKEANVSESYFFRLLRAPLSDQQEKQYLDAIDTIATRKKKGRA